MLQVLRAVRDNVIKPLVLDVMDNLRVSIYGKKDQAGDKPILVDEDGWVYIVNNFDYLVGLDGQANAGIVPVAGKVYKYPFYVKPYLYNGLTWDRMRGTSDYTVFAETIRTGTAVSVDYINHNRFGLFVFVNVITPASGETLTMQVQAKTPTSSTYFLLYQSPAISASGQYLYAIYPGATNVSGHLDGVQDTPLPRTFRIRCIPSGSGSWYYGVGISLV